MIHQVAGGRGGHLEDCLRAVGSGWVLCLHGSKNACSVSFAPLQISLLSFHDPTTLLDSVLANEASHQARTFLRWQLAHARGALVRTRDWGVSAIQVISISHGWC